MKLSSDGRIKMSAFAFAFFFILLTFPDLSTAAKSPPKIQVYSRRPGVYDKENILICHVSDFYPPQIEIDLLKNGVPMAGANQTDLAFDNDWYYHLTKHVKFIPTKDATYACRVTHVDGPKTVHWETDM